MSPEQGERVEHADVVVIGGGPAGSAAAATLARRGRRVVVLEKSRFPRYHIGESLLPYAWWTLERLGALDAVKSRAFQAKYSVRFVTPDGRESQPFTFSDHLDHEAAGTWQVERATFDALLLDHARESGAVVHAQTPVTGVIEEGGRVVGVRGRGPGGPITVRAPITIDASGRDGVVRTLRGWRRAEPSLQRMALWTYYEGIPREAGIHEGATTVVSIPGGGWFWYIPMRDDQISVGVVAKADDLFAHTKDPEAAFAQAVALNPWLAARVAEGRQVGGVAATADYSYRSTYCAEDGVVLVGDAFAFLDPVFSSGVFLALRTGEEAAIAADAALRDGDTSAAAFAAYGAWACAGIEAMRALVFSFYDPQFSMAKLVRAHPELKGDVTDLLIGNLFRDYTALVGALSEVGTVPAPLPYGGARVTSGGASA
jgi:flavin-dependent dehydrogenase